MNIAELESKDFLYISYENKEDLYYAIFLYNDSLGYYDTLKEADDQIADAIQKIENSTNAIEQIHNYGIMSNLSEGSIKQIILNLEQQIENFNHELLLSKDEKTQYDLYVKAKKGHIKSICELVQTRSDWKYDYETIGLMVNNIKTAKEIIEAY